MAKRGTYTFKQRLRYRFDDLFAKGALPVRTDFAGVIAAARDRGETAIGWRCQSLAGHRRELGGAVFLNPPKDMSATFGAEDRVILIA